MKRIILSIALIILSVLVLVSPVMADLQLPTIFSWQDEIARDWDGNPITDCWAYDTNAEGDKYVKLDSQGKAIERKATFETEQTSGPKGWLEVQAIIPEELKGYDVIVGLAGPENYQFNIYEINQYKSLQEVLAGTYKVEVAMIAGDYSNQYPAVYEAEITVYENSTASVFKVDFTPKVEVNEEPSEEITSTEIGTENIDEEENQENNQATPIQIIVIVGLIVLAIITIYVIKKIHDNQYE